MKRKKRVGRASKSGPSNSEREQRTKTDFRKRTERRGEKRPSETIKDTADCSNYQSAIRNSKSAIESLAAPSPALQLLGAHMSISGGAHRAIERGCSIQC